MIRLQPASSHPAIAWPVSNQWSVTEIACKVDRAIAWFGWNLRIQAVNSLGNGAFRVDLADAGDRRRRSLVVDRHTGRIRL